jgi:hypothetical protein
MAIRGQKRKFAFQHEEGGEIFKMIPVAQRNGFRSCPQSGETFWTYQLYRGPDNQKPSVTYCKTLDECGAAASLISSSAVLGLDLEWKPYGGTRPQDEVSVIQLASESNIIIMHMARITGNTSQELLSPAMKSILEDASVVKVGRWIVGDGNRLAKWLGVSPRAFVEVNDHVPKNERSLETSSLGALVQRYLGLPLDKGMETRTSDWHITKPLSPSQIEYAASDAYAGLKLYQTLADRIDFTPQFVDSRIGKTKPAKIDDLFAKLKHRRNELGSEHNKYARQVASNDTLKIIAAELPTTN